MNRRWIAAAVGAVALVALGTGAVMAQTGGTPTTGNSFVDRVAQKLGIESPKLQDAITSVRNEDIDAKVQSGDLTQKQADALKQRAADNPGGPGFGPGGHGNHGPRGFGGDFGAKGLGESEQQLADFLGISKDQLTTELQANNATLATVAAAHGKSTDDLKSFITSTAKSKLDDAMKNGDLTQKVADDMLSMLTSHLDDAINHTGGFGRGFGHMKGFGIENEGAAESGDDANGGAAEDATPPATQGGSAPGSAFNF